MSYNENLRLDQIADEIPDCIGKERCALCGFVYEFVTFHKKNI